MLEIKQKTDGWNTDSNAQVTLCYLGKESTAHKDMVSQYGYLFNYYDHADKFPTLQPTLREIQSVAISKIKTQYFISVNHISQLYRHF
jgi:hypothetical protein